MWPDWVICESSYQQVFSQRGPKYFVTFWTILKNIIKVQTYVAMFWTLSAKLGNFLIQHPVTLPSTHCCRLWIKISTHKNWIFILMLLWRNFLHIYSTSKFIYLLNFLFNLFSRRSVLCHIHSFANPLLWAIFVQKWKCEFAHILALNRTLEAME